MPPKRTEKQRRYNKSKKGKVTKLKYEHSVGGRKMRARQRIKYNRSTKGKVRDEKQRAKRKLVRLACLNHYCQGVPRCMCPGCNVRIVEILEFDHTNDDGYSYRKMGVGSGDALCRWLKKHKYPKDIRVVCPNCHSCRHRKVRCAHAQ